MWEVPGCGRALGCGRYQDVGGHQDVGGLTTFMESCYTAGVMLAHLHQLQSENRRMQARIMELASQREFYIATNTRLHQTLTEHDLAGGNKLANGVRTLGGQSSSAQVSPVPGSQINGESQQLGTKSAPFVVKAVPSDPAAQALDNGTTSVEATLRKMASHGHLLLEQQQQQGGTLPDLEQLAANTTAGRGITLRGTPDVTHVTDSIQTPISTFAALPVGSVPLW